MRVQTTINHISICFLPQYQRQRKWFFSERELKKALRDTLTQAAWYGLYNDKLANQIARLAAIAVKKDFCCSNVSMPCYKTNGKRYSSIKLWMHLGGLLSTQKARVARGDTLRA